MSWQTRRRTTHCRRYSRKGSVSGAALTAGAAARRPHELRRSRTNWIRDSAGDGTPVSSKFVQQTSRDKPTDAASFSISSAPNSCRRLSTFGGSFQRGDVDLVHFHHRIHHALGLGFVRITEHVAENDGGHLPRKPEFVFEPAARARLAAMGEKFLQKITDLVLSLAVHVERDRLVELKLPPAVKRD